MNRWLLSAVLACLSGVPGRAADPLSLDSFDELRERIKPSAKEEKWNRIGWMTSLWQARQRAAREGKPILLWEMDGHPLGCT